MKTKDEVFQEYAKTIAEIDHQAYEAREAARDVLRGQLKALCDKAHEDLKAIRVVEQKARGSKR